MMKTIQEMGRTFSELSRKERAGFLLLLLLVVVAPLPYGSVMPAGAMRIQVLCFVTASLGILANRGRRRIPALPLLALTGVAVVGCFQLVPLSAGTLETLSPASATIYQETNAILESYGRDPIEARISIVPSETVRASLLVLSYICAFIAGTLLTRLRVQRTVLAGLLLANCIGHVVYAGIWRAGDARMHGAFVNPNHFAGYLEIGLAVAFAMMWLEISRPPRREHGEGAADVLERRLVGVALRVIVWAAIGAGIAFTGSRMGTAAAAVTTMLLLLLAILHRGGGRKALIRSAIAIVVLGVGVGLILITTGQLPFLRFLISDPRDPGSDLRFRLWQVSLDAWSSYPHFGSGLGTFREAFRAVQPAEVNMLVEQAHNDTLQLLVTGGWIACSLAIVAIGWLAIVLVRAWRRQTRLPEAVFALGSIGALLSLLLHGLVEFNFSIPAIPTTLAVILGAGWSAATGENEDARNSRRGG